MADGGQRSLDIGNRASFGAGWSVDHDDWNFEHTRSLDFSVSRRSTGVFRDDHFDPIVFQHGDFVSQRKRSASGDVLRMRHIQRRINGVYAADEVTVPGRCFEGQKFLTSKGKEDALRFAADSRNRAFDVGNGRPEIAVHLLPGRSGKAYQRNTRKLRGLNGIGGNAGGIGMCGIHQKVETFRADESGKTLRASKPAGTDWNTLLYRIFRTPRHGQQNAAAGPFAELSRQKAGIGCSAENEYGACHDL